MVNRSRLAVRRYAFMMEGTFALPPESYFLQHDHSNLTIPPAAISHAIS
jgi:hypothetical protein